MSTTEKELIKMEFESIREKVIYVLEIDEESRNSDIRLLCQYLLEFTPYRVVNYNRFDFLIKQIQEEFKNNENIKETTKAQLSTLEHHLSKIPSLNQFPFFSTIHRVRRKIQNEDEIFIPTDLKIAEKRNIRAEVIRDYYIEKNKIEEDDPNY